jgi:restriction system protein
MARRRRRAQTPGERAFEVVEGVTGLWLVLGAISVWPFPIIPSYRPWFFLSAVVVVGVWWWALVVIRKSRAVGKRLDELKAMTPVEFEQWVGARFEDLGYKVKTTALSGDHGVDLVAKRDGEKVVIQCKRYCDTAVGEPTLRDLYGTMQHESADRAYLVTTGYLTPAAISWTRGKPIEIWDGRHLGNMGFAAGTRAMSDLAPSAQDDSTADALSPRCPRCELRLVEKRNRRTGEIFLGCPSFPECRYTRPVASATPLSSL